MAKKKTEFPSEIFVVVEKEGDNLEYLSIREDGPVDEEFTQTTRVARYTLAETGDVQVNRTYKPDRD